MLGGPAGAGGEEGTGVSQRPWCGRGDSLGLGPRQWPPGRLSRDVGNFQGCQLPGPWRGHLSEESKVGGQSYWGWGGGSGGLEPLAPLVPGRSQSIAPAQGMGTHCGGLLPPPAVSSASPEVLCAQGPGVLL